MTRLDELTLNLADDALPEAESIELLRLLAESNQACQIHMRVLQIEAGLRGQRENPELAVAVMARLRSHVAESVAQGVMTQIRTQPAPDWVRPRVSEPDPVKPFSISPGERARVRASVPQTPRRSWKTWSFPFLAGWTGWPLKYARLALAACLVLAVGLGFWLFGPTMGEPALAEVQGSGLSLERAGQSIPAFVGMRLQAADVLRTPTNSVAVIGFAPERTRLTLQAGTELTLAETSHGKRFALRLGKIEASVARQRPFWSMVITTPQAEARVVGTRFTLAMTASATRLDVTEGRVKFTRKADETAVKVGAGHYAVAAANHELAALPFTGGILREWWSGVTAQTFLNDSRLWDHPDGSYMAQSFELEPVTTNRVAVRFRGYVHPTVTGDYEFWLASPDSTLLMSPRENPAEKVKIATSWSPVGSREWDRPRIPYQGGTRRSSPVPLAAGKRYYVEALLFIEKGEGHLSVAWKRPGASRELLTGEYLSPFKPK